jgi:hypothetical protein
MSWTFKKNPPPKPEGFAGKFRGKLVMGFDEFGDPIKVYEPREGAVADGLMRMTEAEFLSATPRRRDLFIHAIAGKKTWRGQCPKYSTDAREIINLLCDEAPRFKIERTERDGERLFVISATGGEQAVHEKYGRMGRMRVQVTHNRLELGLCLAYALLKERIVEA